MNSLITTLKLSSDIKSVFEEKIPKKLIQERDGGGKQKLSYVSGNFVIDQLNRAFNYAWSWSVDECWIQESQPRKYRDKNTNKETLTEQPPVAHVRGTLTAILQDAEGRYVEIKKSATGSKTVVGGASEQESIYKAAGTDALKKAASLFGIAAQLYRDADEQKYFEAQSNKSFWDSEAKATYSIQWEYIDYLYSEFGKESVDEMVDNWSDSKYKNVNEMSPQSLVDFVKYMRTQEAATE